MIDYIIKINKMINHYALILFAQPNKDEK